MKSEGLLTTETYTLIDGELAKRINSMTWYTLYRLTDKACVEVDARGRVLSRFKGRSGEPVTPHPAQSEFAKGRPQSRSRVVKNQTTNLHSNSSDIKNGVRDR